MRENLCSVEMGNKSNMTPPGRDAETDYTHEHGNNQLSSSTCFLPVIVEHRWDVLSRKSVRCVGDQEAGLTHRTIANYNAFDVLHHDAPRPSRPLHLVQAAR